MKAWPGEGGRTIGNKFCRQRPKVVQAMGGGGQRHMREIALLGENLGWKPPGGLVGGTVLIKPLV